MMGRGPTDRPPPAGRPPAGIAAGAVLADVRGRFRAAGLATADLDARLLVAAALGLAPVGLVLEPDRPVAAAAAERAASFAARRLAGEPVGRILGEREFWSLAFRLGPDVLEPRPDTETVVEAALATVPDRRAALRIADLGTGSGALLVALLAELPNAVGVGVDLALGAARAARDNAAANGVGGRALVIRGDFAAALAPGFDLVVSNPPYIASDLIAGLAPEVRMHDPRLALDGGPDGLAPYRVIFAAAPRLLAATGALVVEIGADAAQAVAALAIAAGLAPAAPKHDLGGRPRALTVRLPA